jgi:hypothetical protein
MGRPSKRQLAGRQSGFQKKISIELRNDSIIEFVEIADTQVVDVIDVVSSDVDSSDDGIAELVGFEGDDLEEDAIVLEIEDGEEDPLIFFNGIISDVMNAMICKLEGSTFISHFKQPAETAVLQSFLRNGGSKSQVNKKLAAKLQRKRKVLRHWNAHKLRQRLCYLQRQVLKQKDLQIEQIGDRLVDCWKFALSMVLADSRKFPSLRDLYRQET